MQVLGRKRVRSLLADPDRGVKLSCYSPGGGMLAPNEAARCFAALMQDAERALLARGVDPEEVTRLIAPVIAETESGSFWKQPYDGVAAFSSRTRTTILACSRRFRPFVAAAEHYSIMPLLPILSPQAHGYVLALGRERARLIEMPAEPVEHCAAPARHPVRSEPEPTRIGREIDRTNGWSCMDGRSVPDADAIASYCREVDAALANEIEHADSPVIAAGMPSVTSTFKQVAKHIAVLGTVDEDPDALSAEELGTRAWPMVAGRVSEYDDALVELFNELREQRRASDMPADIERAACEGRVQVLLMSRESLLDSALDGPRAVSAASQGVADESFVNTCAAATLASGGAARLVTKARMPTSAPMAAIYRY